MLKYKNCVSKRFRKSPPNPLTLLSSMPRTQPSLPTSSAFPSQNPSFPSTSQNQRGKDVSIDTRARSASSSKPFSTTPLSPIRENLIRRI